MKYSHIIEHTNFKFILKNRQLLKRLPFYIQTPTEKRSGYSGSAAAYNEGFQIFNDAKKYNGRVFVETTAGDIELFEKDFC
jgi:hypothetical protein